MALIDLIATGREAEQLVQHAEDLQNQVDTANLQHTNDLGNIDALRVRLNQETDIATGLQVKLDTADKLLATDADMITAQAMQIQQAQMQLLQLQSVKVYDGLEFLPWKQTDSKDSKVGGSGLGKAWQKQPGIEMAELGIDPFPPVAPKTANFYDCYYTQDFLPLDDAITRWTMETTFIFPTQADIDACNCLELEMRQVLLVPKGLMFVAGAQINRGSNTLRYWSHGTKPDGSEKGWQATGMPCPALVPLKPMHILVTGHRDAHAIYHDFISVDGVKVVDLTGTNYPAWTEPSPWKQMLRCAIQLDGKEAAVPNQFRVKIGNTKFTVSQ